MKKIPIMYTAEQMNRIQAYIDETFGVGNESMIMHEIKSEYVHTDTAIAAPEGGTRSFVTFGMGARAMNSPIDFKHTELVMSASESFEPYSEAAKIVGGELCRLSKFPFANDTWLGPGHTINASEKFKNSFGFDAFLLSPTELSVCLPDVGEVYFLAIIPIYADERNWIIENGSFEYISLLYDKFGVKLLNVDTRRCHYIPAPDEC